MLMVADGGGMLVVRGFHVGSVSYVSEVCAVVYVEYATGAAWAGGDQVWRWGCW